MKKEIKIPFVENESCVPVIKFTLGNGITGYAVIDTGSESTVFDKDFVKSNKSEFSIEATKNKIKMIGVSDNSGELPVIYASANVKLGSDELVMNGMLFTLVHLEDNLGFKPAALIGSDVLNDLGAKLNFKQNIMTYYNDISGK